MNLHITSDLWLAAFRMAQPVASGQGFRLLPSLPGGTRIVPHPGYFRTLGFTKRLALQLGHFALVKVVFLSLAILT
jgi:hypothetical protein